MRESSLKLSRTSRVSAFALLFSFAAFASGCADGGTTDCDPLCSSAEECCDGTCVFIGECRAPGVDSGRRDSGGIDSGPPPSMCAPECTDAQRCCGGNCINRSFSGMEGRTDPSFSNCNGCGIACDATRASSCSVPGGGAGMARCLCGEFDQCLAGEACVNEGGSFICINTSTDPNNCGAIDNACAAGESCISGVCACGSTGTSCTTGQACCAGSCRDVTADAMNCGGCGVVCGVNGPTCNSGSCGCGTGPACREPMPPSGGGFPIPIPIPGAGDDGDPGELCCADTCVDNTVTNCGMCGFMCASGETCGISMGLFGMGMPEVCCLEEGGLGGFLGCGSGGFPFPGGDGGLGIDGGLPFP